MLISADRIVIEFKAVAHTITCIAPQTGDDGRDFLVSAARGEEGGNEGGGARVGSSRAPSPRVRGAATLGGEETSFGSNATQVRLVACKSEPAPRPEARQHWRFEQIASAADEEAPGLRARRIVHVSTGRCLAALRSDWLVGWGAEATVAKSPLALGVVECGAVPAELTRWELSK